MSATAFALVAASVLCHATWNLLSKRAAVAGTAFVAVWSVVASLIWAPFGIWALVSGEIIFTMAVVINIVVGIIVDNTVHFFNKYLRARRQMRLGPDDSVRYALRESGSAMIVTTLILATGFLILAQSSFLPNSTMSSRFSFRSEEKNEIPTSAYDARNFSSHL